MISSSTTNQPPPPPPPETAWVNTYQNLLPQWRSFSLSHQPGILFQYEPELEFLIWRFSIWVDKPTPGIALMNLRYRDERSVEARPKVRTGLEGPGLTVAQKIWYCIATVGGQYIWACLQSFSAFRRWGDSERRLLTRRAWILIQRIEGLYKAASFSNLLIFLYTGRRCCCCFFLFLTHQLSKNFLAHFQRINRKARQRMTLLALFAKQVQPFHFLLSLVNTGTVIIALGHGALQLRHFVVPDATNPL